MNLTEELKKLGVDVDEGLNRVMGDFPLYEMMLGMFVDAIRDNPVSPEDFDREDLDQLIKRVHTLKGVTGNLSMTPLFTGYQEMLGLLRNGCAKEAREAFERILPVQTQILECINQ